MKKVLFILAVSVLLAGPALAVPSLGPWEEGDARTTHTVFDFIPGTVLGTGGQSGYTALPSPDVISPDVGGVLATIKPDPSTGSVKWDEKSWITGDGGIHINIEMPNFKGGAFKLIIVDIGPDLTVIGPALSLVPANQDPPFEYVVLGRDIVSQWGDGDFGFYIRPNPELEKIDFTVVGVPTQTGAALTALDYIHIDTICVVPAPGAILLGSLGVGFVGWLRRRRAL